MAENINLNKEVFEKRAYTKTINTSFSELGVETIQQQLDSQPTVIEFFNLYNELFYQIPEMGPTNSHEFLVKTSGEYISFEEKDELIEALQLEIATIRKELLQTQQELANALLPDPQPVVDLPEVEDIEIEPITPPVQAIAETPLPEETSTTVENPDIRYGKLRKNVQTLFEDGELENNNIRSTKRDLRQAYEKERNKSNPRKFAQWKKDINEQSSGKDKRDLIKVLKKTRDNLEEGGDGLL